MCHVCAGASVRSEGDGSIFAGLGSTTYTLFDTAPWLGTEENKHQFLQSLKYPNALAQANFFHPTMIFNDPLHVVYRGFGPSFISSCIVALVRSGFFGSGKLQTCYDQAYADATNFAAHLNLDRLSIDEFSRSTLGLEDLYPELACKGADCKTLIYWMAS